MHEVLGSVLGSQVVSGSLYCEREDMCMIHMVCMQISRVSSKGESAGEASPPKCSNY